MVKFAKEILPVNIVDEMKQSYLDYAMSVIVGRALPDVRDGLKPVHRRSLYSMHGLNNVWNKPYKKSARIVGDVLGRYHPHGDTAVYDTIVRMAQPFSLRYMLVDGQGNFGCFTGDTKIKLIDGTEKSFAELAQLSPEEVFFLYSVNQDGKVVIGQGRYARITRKNAELIELMLDNGKKVRCTPDHRFMLRDGTYKEAQDLTTEDSLMPGYFDTAPAKKSLNDYLRVFQPNTGKYDFVHHLADEFNAQKAWIPKINSNDFKALEKYGHNYNHRIIAKRCLTETADTYDITVDKHHNFLLAVGVFVHNSIDSDSPAAMRYTEIRMAKIAHEMLADIDKETVDFTPNYDESELEPTVFPTRIPNLLINGSSGIAVGMATNIPPHNIREVINACIALIEQPNLSVEELMQHLPGPDFPTGGIINGATGILEAYNTGRGKIHIRARTKIEGAEDSKQQIIVTELPYQVNKARLVEKIAELIKDKKIEGISALRDESDKDGIRVVIELRRGEVPEVVLNNLYQHTQMQNVFGINTVALVDRQPRLLSLKQLIELFIRHRREVVTRRTMFELRKAKERAHILEGLAVALSNIDAMIVLIKAAKNPSFARQSLLAQVWKAGVVINMLQQQNAQASRPDGLSIEFGLTDKTNYRLSDAQVQAILELRLHRLTGLEQSKILEEYQALLVRINELLEILNSSERLMQVIRAELLAVRDNYADERRTQIVSEAINISIEDLITEEDMVITLSHGGYVKAQPVSSYSAQRRGGKGKAATKMKEEDFIDKLFIANTHDTILCFSSFGTVYWLKVHQLPKASRTARGKPFVNLLPLEENERISAVLPVREFSKNQFVFMATAKGTVKKTALIDFSRPRTNGIIAIGLVKDDQLIGVDITDGERNVMLFSQNGKAVHFSEKKVRQMGRNARGVRGINLSPEDKMISLIVTQTGSTVLTATVNGFGKRTPVDDYPVKGRSGKGVIAIKTNERNGKVVGAVQVADEDDIVLISNRGTLVRTPVGGISVVSRNTQGVNLISMVKDEQLVGLDRILELGDGEEE